MEKAIRKKLESGKPLSKAQFEWAKDKLGKFEGNCDHCFFNLCVMVGIDPFAYEHDEEPKKAP